MYGRDDGKDSQALAEFTSKRGYSIFTDHNVLHRK